MEASEQIKKFSEFFDLFYKAKIIENSRRGNKFLVVDFAELIKFDPELAELLLEEPDEVIRAAELAIEDSNLEGDIKKFKVRFRNLSKTQRIMIRDIRSKHLGKFFWTEGTVRQKSDVRPQVTVAKFECPACGNTISVPQLDKKFREPSRCGCGKKGKFRLLSKDLVDAQGIVLEEAPEDLDGGEQPKRMNIFLQSDLVSPLSEKRTNPGSKIRVSGIIKEVPITLQTGGQSTRFDLLIEANYIEGIEEDFSDIAISKEELKAIKELSEDPKIYRRLVNSIAPSTYGHDRIKEALILQLMGGVKKNRSDGVSIRGDMHILLIGDPGSGKSQLLKRITKIAPKARYVSGKGVSGAGLTASVVKDEFLRGWSLEAGALVLANKGLCMIDELDKMSAEDRSAMHEALEQQSVSISKANIQATLRAETTVLAAANPKFGRFDPYGTISDQINLPPTLINRFDLIFAIKDIPHPDKDDKMARFILTMHQNPDIDETEVDTKLLRKYIAYARQNVNPKLSDGAVEEIRDYYLKMRASGAVEGGIKTIPISARQLEALVRLSEASARVRLSTIVTKKDAKRGIDILHYCLNEIALDKETGKIDIDKISTGIPSAQRSKIIIVKEIINDLEDKFKPIPIDELTAAAKSKNIDESEVDEIVERLKRSGDIFEPKRGFIQKI